MGSVKHDLVCNFEAGWLMLANFVGEIAGCGKDWYPENMIGEMEESLRSQIGDDSALLGYSGGVDSSTLGCLAAKALNRNGREKLFCAKSVGVMGDERVYSPDIIVRGVKTLDFMTAEGYQFPPDFRRLVTRTLVKSKQIVRVL